MRILIAADSFKDALPAPAVCQAIARGLRQSSPDADIKEFPLADGGEGTLDVLALHLGLQYVDVDTVDPLLRPIRTRYGVSADGKTAAIEMATASGLQLLQPEERNPLLTSTYGTGLMLADAQRRGVERVLLSIGGSATHDAGVGMAAAMGWKFLDAAGHVLAPVGASLPQIARVIPPPASASRPIKVDVICDVTSPLFGPSGAAHIYAAQKGATAAMIEQLDAGTRHLAELLRRIDLAQTPGSGAAGGLGFGALVFLNATLGRGIEIVMDLVGFDAALMQADLVITGEGQLDGQTLYGKLIHGICTRALRFQVPVVALCGRVSASREQITAIGLKGAFSINDVELPLPEMLARTSDHLSQCAANLPLQAILARTGPKFPPAGTIQSG